MKTISITIDETIWQYELDKFNQSESAKIEQANKQREALITHTPEKLRINLPPVSDFIPLSIEGYVNKLIAEKEQAIIQSRTTDHIAIITAQSPEEIARYAKVANLPDSAKDMLAAQVDAIK